MNRFKQARLNAGIQQKTVASDLGISVQSISYWENGSRAPSKENIVKLANMYGVTVDYLLENETDNYKPPIIETKKEPTHLSGPRKKLFIEIEDLEDDEVLRVLDFVSGVRSKKEQK